MASTFDPRFHTHVMLPGGVFSNRTLEIVHSTGKHQQNLRIWVMASYADTFSEMAVPVGDTLTDGYDDSGMRIVSLPAAICVFLTAEEAEANDRIADADARLLRYAVG